MTSKLSKRQQAEATLAKLRSDPAVFRAIAPVEIDGEIRRYGDVQDDWQRRDHEAMDDAWRLVAGQKVTPKYQRAFLERPRGHDKTTGLALNILWVLWASPRKIVGAGFAADKEQAQLLRNAIDRFLRLMPWLGDVIECNKFEVVNKETGSIFTIASADVATSWGLLLDFAACDETTHWSNRELWDSVLSTIAKKKNALLISISNAFYKDSWAFQLRESVRNDSDWYFSRLEGVRASWISPKIISEQKRLLPAQTFDRLWNNNWQASNASGLNQSDVEACCVLRGPSPRRLDRIAIATLDIGVKRDFTGLSVLHVKPAGRSIEVANCWQWRPQDNGGRVDLTNVRETIIAAHDIYKFGVLITDPSQGYLLLDDLANAGIVGIPFAYTSESCDAMTTALTECLQFGILKYYPHPGLKRDFEKMKVVERVVNGHIKQRLDAPRDLDSGHCDLLQAIAHALPACLEIAVNGLPVSGYTTHTSIFDSEPGQVVVPV
jgi:hypothetical protein